MIPRNPASRVALPKSARDEMHFLSPEQIGRLADAVDERYRALVLVAGYTGLRFGELAALRIERLNLLRGSVDVRESLSEVRGQLHTLPTKTGERRTVPLPRFLRAALDAHIARFPSADSYVFTSPDGKVLRRNFYTRHFKPALARAGLDPAVRFHDLRHSAASIAIATGANVKQVQQMLGHSSATVTLDTYSHVFPSLAEQLRDGLDAAYQASLGTNVDQAWTNGGAKVRELAAHPL
jgi:integrase